MLSVFDLRSFTVDAVGCGVRELGEGAVTVVPSSSQRALENGMIGEDSI
jgi:hypothetical protein